MPLSPLHSTNDTGYGGVREASVVLKDLKLVPFVRMAMADFASIDGHWSRSPSLSYFYLGSVEIK